jgi:hypothetical protein
MGGFVLRGALTESEQQWLYQALHAAVDHESEEMESLRRTSTAANMKALNPDNRPQPFVTWVHPYTRCSNARQRPTKLLAWAERLMHALVPASRSHVVDSMLAQCVAAAVAVPIPSAHLWLAAPPAAMLCRHALPLVSALRWPLRWLLRRPLRQPLRGRGDVCACLSVCALVQAVRGRRLAAAPPR